MENLDLPVLQELYLHRNSISKIGNLSGCPRLKKLWLFQNKIISINGINLFNINCIYIHTSIYTYIHIYIYRYIHMYIGLHAVPELVECWLQANEISKLNGVYNCCIIY